MICFFVEMFAKLSTLLFLSFFCVSLSLQEKDYVDIISKKKSVSFIFFLTSHISATFPSQEIL